jgi:hypothetical protein
MLDPLGTGHCRRRSMVSRGPCCPALTRGTSRARGEDSALLLPPSHTASGEPHPVPMERTSLNVSVVICASTEDRWPLLQGSVSSPESDPDGDHRLRRSWRLTFRGVPTAQGAPDRQSLGPRWWCWPNIRVVSVRPEIRQLKSSAVTSWRPIDGPSEEHSIGTHLLRGE